MIPVHPVDAIDRKILAILQEDARTSKAEIGRRVGLTPTAVHERIRKLERQGVITGYTVRLDPKVLGRPILAYVFVSEISPEKRFDSGKALAELPGVEEVFAITGSRDFLVKVRVSGTASLARLLEDLDSVTPIASTETVIVLREFLEELTRLPDGEEPQAD